MGKLIVPQTYTSLLDLQQTELAIKILKDFFQTSFSAELRLRRVTAPLFVLQGMGINDDLNGVEGLVSFPVRDLGDVKEEVVHSLAKWKRIILADYAIENGYGVYTDMNAIRSDEELDNLHSLYVDQWDWEMVIAKEDRTIAFLQQVVKRIYSVMVRAEYAVYEYFPTIKPLLPRDIFFIHAAELLAMYPDKSPKEREYMVTKEHGAVFIMGIGGQLANGEKHDGRAPDYDDWTTIGENGLGGLKGDILVWDSVLQMPLELSSMGIRVDKDALIKQLAITHTEERLQFYYHKRLVEGSLPLSIGGGIGQSRLCMFMLRKAHVGEIQASIWPDSMRKECKELGIFLL